MSEFEFPKRHVTRQFQDDDKIYEEAVTSPVCDFCFDRRVTWDYETDEFYLDEIGFASAEGWAFCDECARLIEARNLPELTARILRSWNELGIPPKEMHVDQAGAIVQGFFDHQRPGRVAFG